jgi:uncharacterized membrane protein YczE
LIKKEFQLIKKYVYHLLGFITIALGIVGVIVSKLGAAPIDAFNYFLYLITPLSLGTVAIITGLVISLISYLIERKKDMLISVIFLFVVGIFIDLWKYLFEFIPNEMSVSFYFRIPLALISIFIISFGVAMTITTGLPSSPFERLLMIINKKIKNLKLSKILIETTFFVFAVILGLITKKLFEQVHIYTIVLVICLGPLIEYFVNILNNRKEKLNYES